ncbi:MAG: hypothetical protein JJ895_04975 [Balneolaceae bacterium]|nr:hypothetical protein [Balneolaceae bacterium]
MPKSLRSRSLWVKFYPQSHEPIVNGNRSHIIEWKGFYKNPDDGYSEVIRFVTRSKYPTEQLNLNTAYIANSDEGFLKICLITKGKSPHLTVLTSTEKVYIRTEGNRRTYYIMRKRGLPKNGSKKSIKSSTKNITDYVDIEPMDQLIHCPICSNSFSNERGLKTHLKQHWQSETLGIFEHLEFDEWVKVIFKLNNNVNE